MDKKKIGLDRMRLALGGNVFGWTIDEPQSFEVLDTFMEGGGSFIDTADVYSYWKPANSGGESETIIGKWMKARGNREEVFLATKVGSSMVGSPEKNLSKAYIIGAVEDSLRRLQTDYIDLYFCHYDDLSRSVEEPLAAFDQLIKDGKVRTTGASNFSPERLKEALDASDRLGYARYEYLQPEYNLYDRAGYENGLERICVEQGIKAVNYYALASGFLSGKYRRPEDLGQSVRGAAVGKYLTERGERILKALDEVSAQYGVKPAQISLAWLLNRPGIAAPIASATSKTQVQELLSAVKLKLNQAALQKLNEASAY